MLYYKRYTLGKSDKEPIRTWTKGRTPTAIEDEHRSIVRSIIDRIYKGRLYVPGDIYEQMELD